MERSPAGNHAANPSVFNLFFVRLPTEPRWPMSAAKYQYFSRLYDGRKSVVTAIDSEDMSMSKMSYYHIKNIFLKIDKSLEVWSRGAAQGMLTTPFHTKEGNSSSYILEYIGKSPVGGVTYIAQIRLKGTLKTFQYLVTTIETLLERTGMIFTFPSRFKECETNLPCTVRMPQPEDRVILFLAYCHNTRSTDLSIRCLEERCWSS